MTRSFICVTTSVIGFHRWPGAPDSVAYLRAQHRHVFHVRAEWSVSHNDRDIEFHQAQRALLTAVQAIAPDSDYGSMSCEDIATAIGGQLISLQLPAPRTVEVWEDNENGARVEW